MIKVMFTVMLTVTFKVAAYGSRVRVSWESLASYSGRGCGPEPAMRTYRRMVVMGRDPSSSRLPRHAEMHAARARRRFRLGGSGLFRLG